MKTDNIKYNTPIVNIDMRITHLKSILNSCDARSVLLLDESVYSGLLFVEDIPVNTHDDMRLENLKHLAKHIYLDQDFTLFDWLKLKTHHHIPAYPIVSAEGDFIELRDDEAILEKFLNTGLIVELSCVLVLRKETLDFKFSEVFQIAEANGAKIFGSYIQSSDKDSTEIVLNLFHTGLNELLQTFRRYDYEIVSYHNEDLHHETLKSNSAYFTKYLTV